MTQQQSEPFRPGDQVVCLDADCGDLVKAGRLVKGARYTVAAAHDGWSLFLRELPGLQFNDRRFARVTVREGGKVP